MLAIIGHVRVDPAKVDGARAAMRAQIEATLAEEGCIAYSYAIDVLDPGLIRVSELWESREHLAAHFKAPHMATWRAVLAGIGISERRITAYPLGEPEEV